MRQSHAELLAIAVGAAIVAWWWYHDSCPTCQERLAAFLSPKRVVITQPMENV